MLRQLAGMVLGFAVGMTLSLTWGYHAQPLGLGGVILLSLMAGLCTAAGGILAIRK